MQECWRYAFCGCAESSSEDEEESSEVSDKSSSDSGKSSSSSEKSSSESDSKQKIKRKTKKKSQLKKSQPPAADRYSKTHLSLQLFSLHFSSQEVCRVQMFACFFRFVSPSLG